LLQNKQGVRNLSNVQMFNQDCLLAMKEMPDKAFELAIVDPPYGIGKFTCEAHTDNNGRRIKNNKIYTDNYQWNQQIPENEYFEQLRRVSKERIIWGANYYNCFEGNKGALVWYKGNMTKTISHCEIASLSFQTKVSYVYIDWQSGFYRFVKEGTQIHPCQKPVALYHWLLKNYAKPGDKILDTHGGSCSIAIACDIMGFDLDVCELDTDYYNAAVERFNRHKQQLKLDFTG
jgi:site-specific DNA-methyltransferase (adenine-specific)